MNDLKKGKNNKLIFLYNYIYIWVLRFYYMIVNIILKKINI